VTFFHTVKARVEKFARMRHLDNMNLYDVMCPSCGEYFSVMGPSPEEGPTEWDYDCEVCCRPMVIIFDDDQAYAKGLGE
jgi:hypothetical protein